MARNRVRIDDEPKRRRGNNGSWRGIRAHNLKLSPDLVADLCDLVEEGVPVETACESVGISRRTLNNWLTAAEAWENPTVEAEPIDYLGNGDSRTVVPERDDAMLPFVFAAQRFRQARARFLMRTIREALNPKTGWRRAKLLMEVLRRRNAACWTVPREIVLHTAVAGGQEAERWA